MHARRLKMSVKEIIEKIDALEDKIDVQCIAEKIASLNRCISVSTTAKVSENEIYELYLHARAAMYTSNVSERAKLYEKLKKTKIELLRELAKRVELDLKKHEILREKCEFCRSHLKRIKVLVEGGIVYEEVLPRCERMIRLQCREAFEYAKIVVKKAKSIELAKIAISKANKRIGRGKGFEAVIGYKYLRDFDCYMRIIAKASECYIPAEFDVCVDVDDDADVKAVDIFLEDIVADENFEKIWVSEKHGTEEHEVFA